MTTPHIIITGNPVDGFEDDGPFADVGAAIGFANTDAHMDGQWWTAPLHAVELPAPPINQGEPISAEVHSDDRVVEVAFDAAAWFAQAGDDDILGLAHEGYSYGHTSDAVALFFEDTTTKEVFEYVAILQRANRETGYGCSVDRAAAERWLADNRPALLAKITEEV